MNVPPKLRKAQFGIVPGEVLKTLLVSAWANASPKLPLHGNTGR
jgi:hypothetical protein